MDNFSEVTETLSSFKYFVSVYVLGVCIYVHECIWYIGTHVYAGEPVHVCMHAGGRQRSTSGVISQSHPPWGMYECFTCTYVCAAHTCLSPAEVRRH